MTLSRNQSPSSPSLSCQMSKYLIGLNASPVRTVNIETLPLQKFCKTCLISLRIILVPLILLLTFRGADCLRKKADKFITL